MNPSDAKHIKQLIKANDRRYGDLFSAQDRKVDAAYASADKALTKAETATEKRLDLLNEFRSQLKDQTGTFITRVEAIAFLMAMMGLFTAMIAGLTALFSLILLLQKLKG